MKVWRKYSYHKYAMVMGLFLLLANVLAAQSSQSVFLHDGWEFSRTDDNIWRKATVPGTVHTDLMQHHLIPDPYVGTNEKAVQWVDKLDWQYRNTFEVNAGWLEQDVVELAFSGLDTYADVYVNEQLVLQADNMFTAPVLNVKPYLKAGSNQLRIVFHSPVKHDMPHFLKEGLIYPAGNDASDIPLSVYARKAPYHYGWDWGPRLITSGIWRPVQLRAWSKAAIRNSFIQQQSLTDKLAVLQAGITLEATQAGEVRVRIESVDKAFKTVEKPATLVKGNQVLQVPFQISQPQRWWPNGLGTQKLYGVKVSLWKGQQEIAAEQVNIGLRTIEVANEPDSLGQSFYVKVNGRPVFMKGTNYIPQDNFLPRVTPEKYQRLFRDMKDGHFNMVRVWGGGVYEDDQFYKLADENGILVWQDFMFACTLYPSDTAFLDKVKAEAAYNITRLRNHPALALWCGNNEVAVAIKNWGWKEGYAYTAAQWQQLQQGYDELFKGLLPAAVKSLDPGRFYFHSSPISNWGKKEEFTIGDNHYWGVWHGMEWFEAYNTHVPRFMSEYGFQSFPDIHTVRRFAAENERSLYSSVMQLHQKSPAKGNTAINTYLEHYYRTPVNFEQFLYVSGILQAEGMKVGIEAHRRAMPYCMGTLYWQMNDCWPGPSWSGIDYYGRWKALQYYVQKAYSPVLVSNVLEDGQLHTYIVSDEMKDQRVTLLMQAIDLDGKVLWEQEKKDVLIPSNSSKLYHSIAPAALWQGADSGKVIFYAKVIKNSKLLSDNVYYFTLARNMALPEPGISTTLTVDDQGIIRVRVSTKKLARNIYLLVDNDAESHFSDNYFDLLPGQEKEITLRSARPLAEIKEQLSVRSLVDTYKQ
jgi:beta-mannosidase